MLPNPIPYSKSESLLLQGHFFCLASCFLIAFLSLSIFFITCAKDCFVESGFFPPFLAAGMMGFSVPSFSDLQQSLVLCVVHAAPCFLQRSYCFLVWAFLGTLPVE